MKILIIANNKGKRLKGGVNMSKNSFIKCDVTSCKHNCQGENCCLSSIKVTCGCGEQCTCCQDYAKK